MIRAGVPRRSVALLDSLLGDRFSIYTSVRVMEHAASLDMERFEDSKFYDKFERARQQTAGRIMLMSQTLGQIQDGITIGFLAAGLEIGSAAEWQKIQTNPADTAHLQPCWKSGSESPVINPASG